MTPKIVHYCWFGGKKKPPAVESFIRNWRQVLPDYQIVEWNETNFDVECCSYVSEAYRAHKFAFVSDYARLYALDRMGGVYLDTDVQVLRSLDPLLTGDVVLGYEEFEYVATSTLIAPKGSKFIRAFMHEYSDRSFLRPDGSEDLTTNVTVLTMMLQRLGLNRDGSPAQITYLDEKIRILDQAKLSPMDYPNGIINSDETTFTIHHFGQSWASSGLRMRRALKHAFVSTVGGSSLKRMRRLFARAQ